MYKGCDASVKKGAIEREERRHASTVVHCYTMQGTDGQTERENECCTGETQRA